MKPSEVKARQDKVIDLIINKKLSAEAAAIRCGYSKDGVLALLSKRGYRSVKMPGTNTRAWEKKEDEL